VKARVRTQLLNWRPTVANRSCTPLRQIDAATAGHDVLFKPEPALRVRWNTNTDTPLPPDEIRSPNPPEGAIINYYLKSAAPGPWPGAAAAGRRVQVRQRQPRPPVEGEAAQGGEVGGARRGRVAAVGADQAAQIKAERIRRHVGRQRIQLGQHAVQLRVGRVRRRAVEARARARSCERDRAGCLAGQVPRPAPQEAGARRGGRPEDVGSARVLAEGEERERERDGVSVKGREGRGRCPTLPLRAVARRFGQA
jgi:hypothetical protein